VRSRSSKHLSGSALLLRARAGGLSRHLPVGSLSGIPRPANAKILKNLRPTCLARALTMVGPIARVDFLPGFDEGGQTNLFIMPPRFRSLRAHASDRYLLLERPLLQSRRPDGSTGHFEGLTLFLYNPEAHQWGQYFANSAAGILNLPVIGEFKNGRGEFFDQETFNDRAILVRMVWSDIITDSHHLEQSFSGDGGKAWEPNFIATMTRENEIQKKSESVCPQPSELPDPHMISTSILVSGKLTSPACNILSPAQIPGLTMRVHRSSAKSGEGAPACSRATSTIRKISRDEASLIGTVSPTSSRTQAVLNRRSLTMEERIGRRIG
jgi:hypothetical protein